MTKYLRYLFTFLTVLVFSCASNIDRNFEDQVSKDLVKSFDLKDKKFKKFAVGDLEKPLVTKKIRSKKVSVKKKTKKKQKKTKPKTSLAKAVKTTEVEKEEFLPEATGELEESEEVKKPRFPPYPSDYPNKFLAYDKRAEEFWYDFTPNIYPGEEFVFEVSFLGITAGHVKMVTEEPVDVGGNPAYHFKAHMKSASYYSMIYKLDDSLESFVSIDDFLPIKYTLIQKESVQNVNDLQLFDRETFKTYYWYKRVKRGIHKKDEQVKFIPKYFQDSYSPLYFLRGFPLNIGDVYEFPIVTRGKIWLLKIKVDKFDEVKIMGKWVKAIKLKAATRFPGVLKKKGDINFWYSADKLRKLLKFEAKVKIGSVEGVLVDYSEGRPLNSVNQPSTISSKPILHRTKR